MKVALSITDEDGEEILVFDCEAWAQAEQIKQDFAANLYPECAAATLRMATADDVRRGTCFVVRGEGDALTLALPSALKEGAP